MHYCEWCGYAHETDYHPRVTYYRLRDLRRKFVDPYFPMNAHEGRILEGVVSLMRACAQICSGVLEE